MSILYNIIIVQLFILTSFPGTSATDISLNPDIKYKYLNCMLIAKNRYGDILTRANGFPIITELLIIFFYNLFFQ